MEEEFYFCIKNYMAHTHRVDKYTKQKMWMCFIVPFLCLFFLWGLRKVGLTIIDNTNIVQNDYRDLKMMFSILWNILIIFFFGIGLGSLPVGLALALSIRSKYLYQKNENTDGIPSEQQKIQYKNTWNWGAAGLTFIWGAYYRVWSVYVLFFIYYVELWVWLIGHELFSTEVYIIILIVFLVVRISAFIFLGKTGGRLAWKNTWLTKEDFRKSQEKWKYLGIAFFVIFICLAIWNGYVVFSSLIL